MILWRDVEFSVNRVFKKIALQCYIVNLVN